MTKKTDVQANAKKPGIAWSAYEDYASFPIETEFVPGTHQITPSGMGFRVTHGAEPEYLPDAHITSEGAQRALSVQLGALHQGTQYNSILFEFPRPMDRYIARVGVEFNAKIEGVRLVFHAIYLDMNRVPPEAFSWHWSDFSVKGDAIYINPDFYDDTTIATVTVYVDTRRDSNIYELPVKIKRVSWLYASSDKRARP